MKIRDLKPDDVVDTLRPYYGKKIDRTMVTKLNSPKYPGTWDARSIAILQTKYGVKRDDYRTKANKFTWRCDDELAKYLKHVKYATGLRDSMQDFMTRVVQAGLDTVKGEKDV